MRLLLLFSVLATSLSQAQNVGIGTSAPQTTLDIRGNQRVGGLSNYMTFDSATGRIQWRNSNLYVPVSQFLLKHSAAGDGLYYNNTAPVSGQLEYRNAAGMPVFFTNFTNGSGYFSGALGVGTTTPGSMLHVRYGLSGYNGPDYFLGATVEGDNNTYLNVLTPDFRESGVLFGNPLNLASGGIVYNNGANPNGLQFRTNGNLTRMLIDAAGNIGIGTDDPAAKLHVHTGTVRFEGLQSGQALSISSAGSVAVDAPFMPGGRLLIQEDGNTGIGTTSPSEKLEVEGNIKAAAYKFTSPKTYYHSMAASAFQASVSTHETLTGWDRAYYFSTNVSGEFLAPVYLPHGATVTAFTVYYEDNSPSVELGVDLCSRPHNSLGFYSPMASVVSIAITGNTSSTDNTIIDNPVNNQTKTYFIRASSRQGNTLLSWPGDDLILRSVVITYTLNEAQ